MSKTDSGRVDLSQADSREIKRRTAIGALIVHEAVRQEGEEELERHPAALMWSALAAGLSMGFSFLAMALIESYLPEDLSWKPLIASAGYAIGFIIVVLGRQQLFTENTLTAVLPLLNRRNAATLLAVSKLWIIVLVANLVGVFFFALAIGETSVVSPEVQQALARIAEAAFNPDFGLTVLRAVFAGWIIALMVWLLPAAETSKVLIVFIMTYMVGLGGFPHIIAGSGEAIYAVIKGLVPVSTYFSQYLLPTLIGNVLGGVILVATLNHLQSVTGRSR